MDKKELQLIQQLMDKLSEEMEYGEEDLSERLGRKKPEIEVVKIEGELPLDEESEEEMFDPSMEDELELEDEELSPEDELKSRLMRLRG